MSLVSSGALQDLMNLPGMEEMPDFGAMVSPQMQAYNFIKAFVILILGIAMLAGGIGAIKLKPLGANHFACSCCMRNSLGFVGFRN